MTIEADELGQCRRCSRELELDERGWAIRHECCQCEDTGRMRLVLPKGDRGFGRAVMCSECWRGAA